MTTTWTIAFAVAKIDASGNFTVLGNVVANGTV